MRWMLNVLIVAAMLSAECLAAGGDEIVGQWTVGDGESRVEIYKSANGEFEGKVCWLQEPNFPFGDVEAGFLKHDRKNPEASMRLHPIIGLVIMKGFKFAGGNRWTSGTVYDPKSGWTYKAKMWLADDQTLNLRGYIGVALLGRTETWKRMPMD